MEKMSNFWEYYRDDQLVKLKELAIKLSDLYPFLIPAVEAHLERIPSQNSLGRPSETLLKIMAELNTTEFGPVFQRFCELESIYGFGDLQVRRLWENLKDYR